MRHLPLALSMLAAFGACSVEQRYQRITNRVDAPGASLTVIEPDGTTATFVDGMATADDPVEVGTAFLIGSNTKTMTAAVVLQLVDEGHLSLDDAASTWVPLLDDAITVRMLLQHTGGLGEYMQHEAFDEDTLVGYDEVWTPEELVAAGLDVGDDGPQAAVAYANTNYVALGMLVEAIDERPFEESLQARIFDPLQMSSAGLVLTGAPAPAHLAWGEAGAFGAPTRWDPSVGWAAGSAYASSADVARFLDAMLAGELFDASLVDEQLTRGDFDDFDDEGQGLESHYGLGVITFDQRGFVASGHVGGVDGFFSAALLHHDTGAVAVMLSNRHADDQGRRNAALQGVDALRLASRQEED